MATPPYGSHAYWEDRYKRDPEAFDWYQKYSGLKDIITQYVRKSDAILHIGCGTSKLAEEMNDDGFSSIVSIDVSPSAIAVMRANTRARSGLSFYVMDACALTHSAHADAAGAAGDAPAFADGSFDAVVDKGLLDSVLCGENSSTTSARVCEGVSRVLKPGGNFIIISFGTPENRLNILERDEYKWRVSVNTIPKPTIAGAPLPDAADPTASHYIYVCHRSA